MFYLFIWPKIWKIILNSEVFHGTDLATVNYISLVVKLDSALDIIQGTYFSTFYKNDERNIFM